MYLLIRYIKKHASSRLRIENSINVKIFHVNKKHALLKSYLNCLIFKYDFQTNLLNRSLEIYADIILVLGKHTEMLVDFLS